MWIEENFMGSKVEPSGGYTVSHIPIHIWTTASHKKSTLEVQIVVKHHVYIIQARNYPDTQRTYPLPVNFSRNYTGDQ